jgi:RimJ/RimL family protein N-acetyltransferase
MSGRWPLFDLRLTSPRLELRYADDSDLLELAEVAGEGIHPPDVMPFMTPWSDAPPAERARSVLQWNWRGRAVLRPESWSLPFAVVSDGRVVGIQDVVASDFEFVREVSTGSWLGQRHQGQGIGTEMRAAVLALAFEGLRSRFALSGAFTDNPASIAVSRRCGYEPDGIARLVRRGRPETQLRLRLSRERWAEFATTPVQIHGLTDEVKAMLGAADPS